VPLCRRGDPRPHPYGCRRMARGQDGSPLLSCAALSPATPNRFIPAPPLPPTNYLSFQQHSRFRRLSAFVFIDIPASFPSFPQGSCVFIDIPASFGQKKNSFLPKQTSCPVEKEDSSAVLVPAGMRLMTDLRLGRRIEKSLPKSSWAPAERTPIILAYYAPPVK
jgi:hypothetical protein